MKRWCSPWNLPERPVLQDPLADHLSRSHRDRRQGSWRQTAQGARRPSRLSERLSSGRRHRRTLEDSACEKCARRETGHRRPGAWSVRPRPEGSPVLPGGHPTHQKCRAPHMSSGEATAGRYAAAECSKANRTCQPGPRQYPRLRGPEYARCRNPLIHWQGRCRCRSERDNDIARRRAMVVYVVRVRRRPDPRPGARNATTVSSSDLP